MSAFTLHRAAWEKVPKDARRPSLYLLVGSLVGGNLYSMVVRTVSGVIQGRLVAPATLGLFNGIGLVLGYVPVLQLGILNGLNRELPYFVGKGDRQRVQELASAAQAWALVVGGAVFLALFGIAVGQLAHGEMWKAAAWSTNAVLAAYLFYNTYYLQMTYRTSHDFSRLALAGVLDSTTGLILLVLVALFNFYGLCLRALLIGTVSLAFLFFWRPVRVAPKWNFGHLKHLLKIGAPIYGAGTLFSWWTVINSTLVLKYAGVEGMGLYAMVLLASAPLDFIPSAVAQVVYPRLAEQYGKSNSIKDLIGITRKPILLTSAGLIPVTAAAWLAVGPFIRLLVPAYAAAIPAMKWSLLLPIVNSFGSLNNIFNVVRRQHLYVTALIIGMAAYGAGLFWLIRDKVALAAFPQAMLAGRVVFMLICWVFIARMRKNESSSPAEAA